MPSVVVVEFQKVRQEYPEFEEVYTRTRQIAAQKAAEAWGISDGGFFPGPTEFGETLIRPRFVQLGTATAIEAWNFNLGTGWKTAWDNTVIEDVYLGVLGLIVPNAQNKITAIKVTAGGKEFPVIPLEGHLEVLTEPIIIFRKGLVIPEESQFKVEVQSKGAGNRTIVPYGFAFAKTKSLINKTPT